MDEVLKESLQLNWKKYRIGLSEVLCVCLVVLQFEQVKPTYQMSTLESLSVTIRWGSAVIAS